jgi:hypothetical protein
MLAFSAEVTMQKLAIAAISIVIVRHLSLNSDSFSVQQALVHKAFSILFYLRHSRRYKYYRSIRALSLVHRPVGTTPL